MMASNAYTLSEHFIDYSGSATARLPGRRCCTGCTRSTGSIRPGRVDLRRRADDQPSSASARRSAQPGLGRIRRFGPPPARAATTRSSAASSPRLHPRARRRAGTRNLTRAHGACVQAYDGSHAAYVFDAPWAERLGLVEEGRRRGRGPYRRYGRVVRAEARRRAPRHSRRRRRADAQHTRPSSAMPTTRSRRCWPPDASAHLRDTSTHRERSPLPPTANRREIS